jgi:hypothetical protein
MHRRRYSAVQLIACLLLTASSAAFGQDSATDTRPTVAPDIREDDTRLKIQKGDFVAVPIPISNPTLDTGLVAGVAYFFAQNEAQRQAQPASVVGIGGMYTTSESKAIGLFQQDYWRNDRWRFTGALGAADVRLSLVSPEDTSQQESLDWRIKGGFLFARLSRRLTGDWYGGGLMRFVDASQTIESAAEAGGSEFDTSKGTRASGVGLTVEYDTRDMPTNPYAGRYFTAEALFNDEAIGSSRTYQAYTAGFRSYHAIADSLVFAFELQGCRKAGTPPLWDACRVPLRGFPAFRYLGTSSASGQVEARWRAYKRFGLVAFGGSGWAGSSFSSAGGDETVTSYGAGLRFEVLPAKRINLRIDFAWSDDDEGIHVSVGEAF